MSEVRELFTDDEIRDAKDPACCGACGRWWDDGIVTAVTPVPSGRCPFEYEHEYTVERHPVDGFTLWYWEGDTYRHQRFIGYTVPEAVAELDNKKG